MPFMNPSKILFFMTVMTGTFLVSSSNSWLMTWIGLEMNLLTFIPLMMNKSNILTSEASMKYFIIQAMASSMFLLITLMEMMFPYLKYAFSLNCNNMLIFMTLLIKMGAAPFHFWFPSVMEGLSWMNCFILMSWQKLAPMIIISHLYMKNYILYTSIILSTIIGSIGGLNQTSIRKIMTYSSINHISWMLLAMLISEKLWLIYFFIYSFMTLTLILSFMNLSNSHINQMTLNYITPLMKTYMLFNMLSLGGLPPFLGFFPKWVIIQNSMFHSMYFLIVLMMMWTLVTLFYYIQLMTACIILNNIQLKWNLKMQNINNQLLISLFSSLSLFGLPIFCFLNLNL